MKIAVHPSVGGVNSPVRRVWKAGTFSAQSEPASPGKPGNSPVHPVSALPHPSFRFLFLRGGGFAFWLLLFEFFQDGAFLRGLKDFPRLLQKQIGQAGVDLIHHQGITVAGIAAIILPGKYMPFYP